MPTHSKPAFCRHTPPTKRAGIKSAYIKSAPVASAPAEHPPAKRLWALSVCCLASMILLGAAPLAAQENSKTRSPADQTPTANDQTPTANKARTGNQTAKPDPAATEQPTRTDKRPNILWFIVDDMSANFSCYGEQAIRTPNVDRLAAEGTKFTHAFVTAPVCSPCRSALITGMYQTTIGAHQHRSGRGVEKIVLPEHVRPVPELFQQAGYFTCIGDGLDGGPGARRPNRNARANAQTNAQANAQNNSQAGALGKTDYNFEWQAAMYDAADWSKRSPNQPFFMQVQLAGGKLRGGTDQSAIRLSQRADKELGGAVSTDQVQLPPYYPRDPVLLRDWAAYLDAVRFTDQHVGQVLARLEREGILDQTLVIFMTDHGISHARGKQFLYDEGTHVPLVVRSPKDFPKLLSKIPAGNVRDDFVQQIDLAAISLAAAGIPIPDSMQGRDVFADDYRRRDAIFAARDRCDETIDRIRSVRSERYLYIRNFYPDQPHLQPNAYKDGKSILKSLRDLHASQQLNPLTEQLLFSARRPAEELYDWRTDRWQVNNLADVAEHASALQEMRERLDRWIEETHDQGAEKESMYDSDMTVYVGDGNPVVQRNIAEMKKWHWPRQ